MPQFLGMDEAGYGPNLGPLVITVTDWPLPNDPRTCDVWSMLSKAVSRTAANRQGRIHVGDSKDVYTPSRGLASLETSVLTILRTTGVRSQSFHSLGRALAVEWPGEEQQEPWFNSDDIALPVCADAGAIEAASAMLTDCLDSSRIGQPRIRSDVVLTERFNRLAEAAGSKGRILSSLSLSLLRTLWAPEDEESLVICDKHGGRNRYDELLSGVLEEQMIFRIEEGRERSVYRVGSSEVCFQMKAEAHFPVAVASLVSKYLRELSMLMFNQYWQRYLPHLKPTKGYPTDARRFKNDIADKQAELGISDQILWRCR